MSDRNTLGNGESGLDEFFLAARESVPPPDDALFSRVLEDAKSCQDRFGGLARTRTGGWFRQMRELAAGWFVAGALATSACAGFAFGYVTPGLIGTVAPFSATGEDAAVLDALAVPAADDVFLGELQ